MSSFLITMPSATAAFSAEKLLKEAGIQVKVVAVPADLSNTCYGLGVEVTSKENMPIREIQIIENGGGKWKRCWKKTEGTYEMVLEPKSEAIR